MNAAFLTAAPVRRDRELEQYEAVDQRLRHIAASFGAFNLQYPALIAADVLARAEYSRAFPHLLMIAGRLAHPEAAATDNDTFASQTATNWCLSPAVCYHVYAQLTGSVLAEPMVVTARGNCFRYECDCAPGIRQVEFAMREIVLLGSPKWIHTTMRAVAREVQALARELGLAGRWRPASDPFFLPSAEGKAIVQRLTGVKREYQSLDHAGLALVSVNRHGAFFGRRFRISGKDGEAIHTACIAVGLDRWFHTASHTEFEGRREPEVVP